MIKMTVFLEEESNCKMQVIYTLLYFFSYAYLIFLTWFDSTNIASQTENWRKEFRMSIISIYAFSFRVLTYLW